MSRYPIVSLAEFMEMYGPKNREGAKQPKPDAPFMRPISELLTAPDVPICDARLATYAWSHDSCIRRVNVEGERCWQHR